MTPPVLAYITDTVSIYTGDARSTLATLATDSVDSVVTSPPYWGLRDYGTGQWVGGDPPCAHSAGRGTNIPHTTGTAVGYPASSAHRKPSKVSAAGKRSLKVIALVFSKRRKSASRSLRVRSGSIAGPSRRP